MNMQETRELLVRLSPLRDLSTESVTKLADVAEFRLFAPGTINDFEWANKVVYLLRGQIKLGNPDGGSLVLVGGAGDALAPLNQNGKHPVNVRAITEVELLCFDENELDVLMTWDQMMPGGGRQPGDIADAADWHNMSGAFDARMLRCDVFANLPAANIDNLLACFKRQSVRAGEVIVRQGERGDHYYVIERGRASVLRDVAGASIELAQLQAGDAFGEEALVADAARNATVIMKTDGELLRLDGTDFVLLLREPLLQRISAQRALEQIDAGATWLDVRFPAEYRQDGLPGAMNIPLNELREAIPGLPKDKTYIAYCQSGRRSSAAAFLMSQRGLHAFLLDGGLKTMMTTAKKAA